jgi:hypothetical protein
MPDWTSSSIQSAPMRVGVRAQPPQEALGRGDEPALAGHRLEQERGDLALADRRLHRSLSCAR